MRLCLRPSDTSVAASRIGAPIPSTTGTPNCSLSHFVEMPGAWPIGIGHPCFGCTEQKIGFRVPLHDTVDVERPTAPGTYPPIHADHSVVTPTVVGASAAIVGALVGAGYVATRKITTDSEKHARKE